MASRGAVQPWTPATFVSKESVARAFRMFDNDGSDQISIKEFFDGCRSVGLPITFKQVAIISL